LACAADIAAYAVDTAAGEAAERAVGADVLVSRRAIAGLVGLGPSGVAARRA
jgi:hypothetical protein